MKVEQHLIKVRDVIEDYEDKHDEGVMAYKGKLDIRPKYQREFVYKDEQRDAVIKTILSAYPLNVMYWAKNGKDKFEVLDGQQRTISIGRYISGDFSIDNLYFHNRSDEEQNCILDYELMIYFCEGTNDELLEWFQIVNIAGEELHPQELRNAVYTGPWLSQAKSIFSKRDCAAYLLAREDGKLINAKLNRQEYLETALSWINNGEIKEYMAKHQHDKDAKELWDYFQLVIGWVRKTFTTYREEMAQVKWGELYNKYKVEKLSAKKLEGKISKLMQDEDVTSKPGIYSYVLTEEEKYLSIRSFSKEMKREAYERQEGICPHCKAENKPKREQKWEMKEMEADHKKPWKDGGKTNAPNCQMLCKDHNRSKSGK